MHFLTVHANIGVLTCASLSHGIFEMKNVEFKKYTVNNRSMFVHVIMLNLDNKYLHLYAFYV